ncbi:hypothetical protein GCM10022243_63000 [Saccharothrix violaceirubra]|uniref:Basic proline-rich protein n=1 Tax=Saccharothrix violaceirubra TaxID=413306 RepID=A0A7W7SXF3_9PSEU|nr:hypothetical protein [Saccharothrix violaceirubra]MBB4962752.1 hypothetical protein [Saccharothrix violaceirubra]
MSRESESEQTTRTVAELLAQYGGASGDAQPRRRRRRAAEDASDTAPQSIIDRVNSDSGRLLPIRDEPPPAATPPPVAPPPITPPPAAPPPPPASKRGRSSPPRRPEPERTTYAPPVRTDPAPTSRMDPVDLPRRTGEPQRHEPQRHDPFGAETFAGGDPFDGPETGPSRRAEPGAARPFGGPETSSSRLDPMVGPEASSPRLDRRAETSSSRLDPVRRAETSSSRLDPVRRAETSSSRLDPFAGAPRRGVPEDAAERTSVVPPIVDDFEPPRRPGPPPLPAREPVTEVMPRIDERPDLPLEARPTESVLIVPPAPARMPDPIPGQSPEDWFGDDEPQPRREGIEQEGTQFHPYVDLDEEDDRGPAGLDDEKPAGLADDDEEDAPARRSPGKEWALMIGQLAIGIVGGAALWLGFSFLWRTLAPAALVVALAVTVGLVLMVRKIRRADDLQTTVLAVLVGLIVTVSPAAMLLVKS